MTEVGMNRNKAALLFLIFNMCNLPVAIINLERDKYIYMSSLRVIHY